MADGPVYEVCFGDGTNNDVVEARLTKWKVRAGSRVSQGTVLLLYDVLDKSKSGKGEETTRKVKATSVGTIKVLLKQEGDVIHQGCGLLMMQGCSHPIVMKDMCAECGADLLEIQKEKKQSTASVSMVHSVPELMVSQEQAEILGRADEERLIKSRKLVLLVDLDQTLIHTTNDDIPANLKDVHHFQMHGAKSPWYHVRLRPGTISFLEKISNLYELHICTFGARLYAHIIAKFLDRDGRFFSHRILSRDECFNANSKIANMKALFPCGDQLVCIIDDREDVWNFAPNLVHVKPYHFFQHTGDINAPPGLSKTENDSKDPYTADGRKRKKKTKTSTNVNDEGRPVEPQTNETVKVDDVEMISSESEVKADLTEETKEVRELCTDVKLDNDDVESSKTEEEPVLIDLTKGEEQNRGESSKTEELGRIESAKTEEPERVESMQTEEPELIESAKTEKQERVESTKTLEPERVESMQTEEPELIESTKTEKLERVESTKTLEPERVESAKTEEPELIESAKSDEPEPVESMKIKAERMETSTTEEVQRNELTKEEEHNRIELSKLEDEAKEPTNKISIVEPITSTLNGTEPNAEKTESDDENGSIDIEDEDDYLLYLTDILTKIHKAFYKAYDRMQEENVPGVPSLKTTVPSVRRSVLRGVNIVFSGVIPTNAPIEKSRAFHVAKCLGADIQSRLVPKGNETGIGKSRATTHVVAARLGTVKVSEAKKMPGVHIVTPDWLWCCADRWDRVDERLFPLTKSSVTIEPKGSTGLPTDKLDSTSEESKVQRSAATRQNEICEVFPTYDPVTGKRIKKTIKQNGREEIEVIPRPNYEPPVVPSTSNGSGDSASNTFSESINPLMIFSNEDIENMDREVEDFLDSSNDDSSEPDVDDVTKKLVLRGNNEDKSGSSSSDESLSAERPKGWGKRKKEDEDEDQKDQDSSSKYRRCEIEPNSDNEQNESEDDDGESIGSIDEEMAAEVERQFLGL